VLLGDYMLIDPSQHALIMNNATSIEASFTDPLTTTAGQYTFYGRFNGWTAVDNREALATSWVVQGDTGNGSTIVWRDPKVAPASFVCGAGAPSYAPLSQEGFTFFDRSEFPTVLPPAPSVVNPSPPPLIFAPVATQIAATDATTMQLPSSKMGFIWMDLNTTVAPAGPNPPVDPAASQSLVVVLVNNKNVPTLATGTVAVPLDNASKALHFFPH
jgi:hypothetical protein